MMAWDSEEMGTLAYFCFAWERVGWLSGSAPHTVPTVRVPSPVGAVRGAEARSPAPLRVCLEAVMGEGRATG